MGGSEAAGRVRALLVAVEEYGGDLMPLAGVIAELRGLRRWLIDRRGARPEDVIVCAGPAYDERTFGNTREEIAAAARRLVAEGADRTDTLYVYLGGRGFRCPGSPYSHAIDLFAPRDLVDLADAGRKAVPVLELQRDLAFALGPGDHYHFVDARRSTLPADALEPAAIDVDGRSRRGRARVFALLAASAGRGPVADARLAAAVQAGFEACGGDHVDDGERGGGGGFARLTERVRARLGGHELEAIGDEAARPLPVVAVDGTAEMDRATRWSVEIGERILRPCGPGAWPLALPGGDGAREATAALYLLAAFADPRRAQRASLGPARLQPVEWAPGAAARLVELAPGPQRFEVAVPGWQPLEVATCTLFGHVTAVVLADDDDGRLDLRQLILPSPQLVGRMPGPLRFPTRALRFIAEAQRRLGRGLPIVNEAAEWERARWDDLVAARWVDPVLSLVAAYALLRRGGSGDVAAVATIVRALRTRYPGLPDTDVIAAAAGIEAYSVAGWPLFVDGIMRLPPTPHPSAGALAGEGAWTVFRLPSPPMPAARALFS